MEDQALDDGIDISITDEVEGELDLIAGTTPKKPGYMEQDN